MTIIRNAAGSIIRRSRNLRGMIEHARRTAPVSACLADSPAPLEHGARYVLIVTYGNGDKAYSPYADPIVAGRFLNSRRSWGRIQVAGHEKFREEYASGRRLW